MILKHRDTEILRFDWETSFGVKNVELNPSAERFLPLAFRDKVRKDPASLRYELELWLLNRTPPVSRAGISETLKHLGFRVEDPSWKRDLITFGRGLSLNDVHWIVKDDSTEKWDSTNLYDNPFSTVVASMAFTGDRRVDIRDAASSPEYSTDGNLRKCWRRIDGQVLLFKGGGHDDGGFAERNAVDALVERLVGLEHFEFKPHPKFVWPDNRLEVSQYFLRNRIEKIIRYREKADKYLKINVKDDTINPTITNDMLKQAAVADDLRRELKATLKSFPKASTEKLAILFKTSTRTIARHIKALQEAGELRRVGSRKTGYWQVTIEKLNESLGEATQLQ